MNTISVTTTRRLYLIGHLFFISYILLALWFFRERVLFGDAGFLTWNILQFKSFAIFHNRFAPAVAQLLPVGGVKAGFSLNAVLLLYSATVPLIIYICYLVIAHGLRRPVMGIGLAVAASFMLSEGFYYSTGEINQGVAALVLLSALVITTTQMRWWHWLCAAGLLIFGLFLHPLVLVGCIYVSGYVLINGLEHRKQWVRGAVLLLLTILIHVFRTFFLETPYEAGKMSLFALLVKLPQLASMPIAAKLGEWMLKHYYLLLIGSATLLFWYIKRKKWLPLLWYFGFAIGFAIIAILGIEWGADHIRFYMEHHYQLFALFLALPLSVEVLPQWLKQHPKPVIAVLAFVLLSRLVIIYASHTKFTNQHLWFDKIYDYTSNLEHRKYLVNKDNLKLMLSENSMYWPIGYSSTLYFTSTHKDPAKSIIIPDDYSQFDQHLHDEELHLGLFGNTPYYQLDPKYFSLASGHYFKLNTEPQELPSEALVAGTLLQTQEKKVTGKRRTGGMQIPITITSKNGLIHSGLGGPNKTTLGFKVYHKQNHEFIWHYPESTPLEVDISGSFTQNMQIPIAEEEGEYIIEIDLFTFPDTWWNVGTEIEMTVKR